MKKTKPPKAKLKTDIATLADLAKLRNGTVSEVTCHNKLQFIPAGERGKFMDELWRVLEPGGLVHITVPYYSSIKAISDFASQWPPFSEMSFLYFDKAQRDAAGGIHPELKCDFEIRNWGYTVQQDVAGRNEETRAVWIKRNLNTAEELQVHLAKR